MNPKIIKKNNHSIFDRVFIEPLIGFNVFLFISYILCVFFQAALPPMALHPPLQPGCSRRDIDRGQRTRTQRLRALLLLLIVPGSQGAN